MDDTTPTPATYTNRAIREVVAITAGLTAGMLREALALGEGCTGHTDGPHCDTILAEAFTMGSEAIDGPAGDPVRMEQVVDPILGAISHPDGEPVDPLYDAAVRDRIRQLRHMLEGGITAGDLTYDLVVSDAIVTGQVLARPIEALMASHPVPGFMDVPEACPGRAALTGPIDGRLCEIWACLRGAFDDPEADDMASWRDVLAYATMCPGGLGAVTGAPGCLLDRLKSIDLYVILLVLEAVVGRHGPGWDYLAEGPDVLELRWELSGGPVMK